MIKLDNADKQYSILTNSDYNNIHQQYALKVESNSKLYFLAGDKLFESNGINYSSSSINNGQWTHTLVSYDGNKLKLYLNGNLDYENQIIDNFPESPSSVAFIGNSWGANNDFSRSNRWCKYLEQSINWKRNSKPLYLINWWYYIKWDC